MIRNFDEVGPFMLQRLYRELAAVHNDKALAFFEELRRESRDSRAVDRRDTLSGAATSDTAGAGPRWRGATTVLDDLDLRHAL